MTKGNRIFMVYKQSFMRKGNFIVYKQAIHSRQQNLGKELPSQVSKVQGRKVCMTNICAGKIDKGPLTYVT